MSFWCIVFITIWIFTPKNEKRKNHDLSRKFKLFNYLKNSKEFKFTTLNLKLFKNWIFWTKIKALQQFVTIIIHEFYLIFQGLDSHYGTKGMRKVTVECPGGQKVTFQFSYVAGNNNGTSVEDGQIPELIFYT